jgi:hypothetical protein
MLTVLGVGVTPECKFKRGLAVGIYRCRGLRPLRTKTRSLLLVWVMLFASPLEKGD